MGELQKRLHDIFDGLRRVKIDPRKIPCFPILEPTQGDGGEAFRPPLPKVLLLKYEDDKDNLPRVYGDERAFFLTWPDRRIDTPSCSVHTCDRPGGSPAVNGVVVVIRAAELANRSEVSVLGDDIYRLLKALRDVTGIHAPHFVFVLAKPSPNGEREIFEKTVFPFDLWHVPVPSEGQADVSKVPEVIRNEVSQLLLDRFTRGPPGVSAPSQGRSSPAARTTRPSFLTRPRSSTTRGASAISARTTWPNPLPRPRSSTTRWAATPAPISGTSSGPGSGGWPTCRNRVTPWNTSSARL